MTRRSFIHRDRRGRSWSATSVVLGLSLLFAGIGSAKAQEITLTIVGGTGAPGGSAKATVVLSGDAANAAVGAGLDVLFPENGGLTINPGQDCALAPRLQTTHILQARLGTSAPPNQRLILDVGTKIPDINPISDGDLVTCTFQIASDAALGTVPLTVASGSVLVSDKDAHTLPATGVDGEVTIALVTPTPTVTNTLVQPTNTPTTTPVQPTSTPTNTRTNTPVGPTNTPTNTPGQPTGTATATRTKTPVGPTPTNTGGGAAAFSDGGGCNISASSGADVSPLAWLIVPAALLLRRRRAQR